MAYKKRSKWSVFSRSGGWIGAVILGLGLVCAGPAVSYLGFEYQLSRHGVTVTGTVTDLADRRARRNKRNHVVVYVFRTAEGVDVTGRQRVSAATLNDLVEQQPIAVTYLPQDPSKSEVNRFRPTRIGLIWLATLAGLAIFGVLWLRKYWRQAEDVLALREFGQVRRAKVTEHNPLKNKHNRTRSWTALWVDDAGTKGETFVHGAATLPAVGNAITIYADPKGDAKSVWEGDVGTR